MNKQKLMSVLQSRISRRSYLITRMGEFATTRAMKAQYKRFIVEQKQDKQLLRQLILDERELKHLKKELKSARVQVIKLCDSIVRMDEEITHLHKVTMDGLL